MVKMNVHTLVVLTAIAIANALGGCTSAYTVSEQKLASGDCQGAEETLGSRSSQKAEQIRVQILKCQRQSELTAELKSATRALESGQYVTAHGDYLSTLSADEAGYLGEVQRREALDGLCLTENKIGAPQYSLQQQRGSCAVAAAAAAQPSGAVTAVLSDVEQKLSSQYSATIASSIAAKDADDAERVVGQYRQLPHPYQPQIELWQTQIGATYLLDLQKAVSIKDWQSARSDLKKYSELSTASPEVVSEWNKKIDDLELPERLARERDEAAAESRVRESAKSSFCRAMEMAVEYEVASGLRWRLRAAGMDEDRVKTTLWMKALEDVGQESIVPLIEDLADENSVPLHTSSDIVTQEWLGIVNSSIQGGGPEHCSN